MKSTKARKVLMSVAALAVTGVITGAGTWATFTSTRTATHDVEAGTVSLKLDNDVATVAFGTVGNVAPGDTWTRYVQLDNESTLDLASFELAGADAVTSNSLTGGTTPLQVTVTGCDVAWVEGTCAGSTTTVASVQNAKIATAVNLGSLTTESTSFLKFSFELPAGANNDYQGDTSDLTYTFSAVQRAGAPQS